jgi:hypothetical protein
MRHQVTVLLMVLTGVSILWSCALLPAARRDWIQPIAIPTSNVMPRPVEVIVAEMRDDGICLYMTGIEGTSRGRDILPIWPRGFSAEVGPRTRQLYSGPGQESNAFAVGAEKIELHGEFVDVAPADAHVSPECTKYPLFLVGQAFNRS